MAATRHAAKTPPVQKAVSVGKNRILMAKVLGFFLNFKNYSFIVDSERVSDATRCNYSEAPAEKTRYNGSPVNEIEVYCARTYSYHHLWS